MGYKIESCTVDDADALARNNGSAFWNQPYWRLVWPLDIQQDFLIEQLRKRFASSVLLRDRDVRRHEKAVDVNSGAVVGYCRWVLPDSQKMTADGDPEWPERQVPDVSPEQSKALEEQAASAWWEPRKDMSELDGKIDDERLRVLAGITRPYMELDYLAVHPDNQGKGIASLLVASGLRHAERLKLPVFLMAFDISRGLYARQGFREISSVLQDDSKFGGNGNYNAYFMIYEPSSGREATGSS